MENDNLRIKVRKIEMDEEGEEDQWLLWNAAEVEVEVKQEEAEVKQEERGEDDLATQGAEAAAREGPQQDSGQEPEDEEEDQGGRIASGDEGRKRKSRDEEEKDEEVRIQKLQDQLAGLRKEQRDEERKLEKVTRGLHLIHSRIEDVTNKLLKIGILRNKGKRPRCSTPPRTDDAVAKDTANVATSDSDTPRSPTNGTTGGMRKQEEGSGGRQSPHKDGVLLPSYNVDDIRELPPEFRGQLLRVARRSRSGVPRSRRPFAVGRALLEACRHGRRHDRPHEIFHVRCTDATDRLHIVPLPPLMRRALKSYDFRQRPPLVGLPVLRRAFPKTEVFGFRLRRGKDGLCELHSPPTLYMARSAPHVRHGTWHDVVDGREPRAFVARFRSSLSDSCVRLIFFYNCDPGLEGIVGYVVEPDMGSHMMDLGERHHDCNSPSSTCHWGKVRRT